MKEFEVNGVQYMAVEALKESSNFFIGGNVLFYSYSPILRGLTSIQLPKGRWEIVGQVKDIFDNNAKKEIMKHNLNDNSLILKKI